jgi:hypothetical protein
MQLWKNPIVFTIIVFTNLFPLEAIVRILFYFSPDLGLWIPAEVFSFILNIQAVSLYKNVFPYQGILPFPSSYDFRLSIKINIKLNTNI